MKRVRVLVVDDSATSRLLLVEILRADEQVEVVGQAADGVEAVEMVKRLSPDIVTMDVQMPRLDGFAATKRIMVEAPTPILIITSIDAHALSISLEAIRAGALAVQAKPGDPSAPGFEEEARELVRQVKAMSEVKVVRHHRQPAQTPAPAAALDGGADAVPRSSAGVLHDVPAEVVAIAASTGGPAALHRILTPLTADFPLPLLVVQHISRGFGPGLVQRPDFVEGQQRKQRGNAAQFGDRGPAPGAGGQVCLVLTTLRTRQRTQDVGSVPGRVTIAAVQCFTALGYTE